MKLLLLIFLINCNLYAYSQSDSVEEVYVFFGRVVKSSNRVEYRYPNNISGDKNNRIQVEKNKYYFMSWDDSGLILKRIGIQTYLMIDTIMMADSMEYEYSTMGLFDEDTTYPNVVIMTLFSLRLHGEYYQYDSFTHKLTFAGRYKKGKAHGRFRYYNAHGCLLEKKKFRHGRMISHTPIKRRRKPC
jgi:antitoxin component YwqK of YwqJK toxin-antitoxin module